MPGIRQSEEDRFFSYVEITGFCWLWTGYRNPAGYGKFNTGTSRATKGSEYAHRWAYAHLVGPIPDGMAIDHLCRIPACLNPDHLEPVTLVENTRRKPAPAVCIRGHDLSEAYIRPGTGNRMCTRCLTINAAHRAGRICSDAACIECVAA